MKPMKYLVFVRQVLASLSFGLLSSFAESAEDPCIRVRAALDIGSAQTKLKVAKYDICKMHLKEIIYPAKGEESNAKRSIEFKKDLIDTEENDRTELRSSFNVSEYPKFSDAMISGAKKSFKELKELASRFNPVDYTAVATQAFRDSKNATVLVDYLKKDLNIETLVPSQAQEALLEWSAATSLFADQTSISQNALITLGIGGGSMQMGAMKKDGKFIAFASSLASDNMYDLSKDTVKGNGTLLPVSKEQINMMIDIARKEANTASTDIKDQVGYAVKVIGVGGVINKSVKDLLKKNGKDRNFFTKTDVKDLLDSFEGQESNFPLMSDVPEQYRDQVVSNLALVYGVMDSFGIEQINFSPIDNTYSAPFMKQFAIRMPPKKTPAVSAVAVSLRQVAKSKSSPVIAKVSQEVEFTAPVVGDFNDENMDVCKANAIYELKQEKGKMYCYIKQPCQQFQQICVTVKGNQCIVPGKTTLVFNLCSKS